MLAGSRINKHINVRALTGFVARVRPKQVKGIHAFGAQRVLGRFQLRNDFAPVHDYSSCISSSI
jgi:hypothetical protein